MNQISFTDEIFLQRALELANLGGNRVAPNPRVGAVVVYNNQIIGEGYHQAYGGPHAEVFAINAVKDKSLLSQSVLFVSLEPCDHFGKTPPCTELIIRSGISKVVIGSVDPNPRVSGKGVARLKQAGIEVEFARDSSLFMRLNKFFFTNQLECRPFITLKWAETANGIMGSSRERLIISGEEALYFTHRLRAQHHGILVGQNTVAIDNPYLTVRYFPGNNPIRLILDPRLQLSLTVNFFAANAEVWVINSVREGVSGNIRYILVPDVGNQPWAIPALMDYLYNAFSLSSLLVEGGAFTLEQFIMANYWDEIFILRSPKWVKGDIKAPQASIFLEPHYIGELGQDRLYYLSKPLGG
jgi:diaminohydroxyphosphoribosylaminopyrimidine deaminase/5-amino-6-(5-phosphoribosylamino)uracil reductase